MDYRVWTIVHSPQSTSHHRPLSYMWNVLAIAVGGAIGAVCRYAVTLACRQWFGAHFAFGTLTANVIGCFLFGLLLPLGTGPVARWGPVAHMAMTTGFLGALTTFSTFGIDTMMHVENARHDLAVLNVALNLVVGLTAVSAGLALGRHLAS